MTVIPANTVFKVNDSLFAAQGSGDLQFSVDGVTFTKLVTVSNNQVISNCPAGIFLKCATELKLSCHAEIVKHSVDLKVIAPRATYDNSPAQYRAVGSDFYGGTITVAGVAGYTSYREWFNHGASVAVVAVPATGFVFSHWSDGNTTASRTLTINEAMSLEARFNKV